MEITERTFEKIEKNFRKRIKSDFFRQAVRAAGEMSEEMTVPSTAEALAMWAGEKLWREGYKAKEFAALVKRFDFDRALGVGIEMRAVRDKETIRQFCYQFIRLAEATREENEELRAVIRDLQGNFIYRGIIFYQQVIISLRQEWRQLHWDLCRMWYEWRNRRDEEC